MKRTIHHLLCSTLLALSPFAHTAPATADALLAAGSNLQFCHVIIAPIPEANRRTPSPETTTTCHGIAVENFSDGGIYHFFLNQGVRLSLVTLDRPIVNNLGTIDRYITMLTSVQNGQQITIPGSGKCTEMPSQSVFCHYDSTVDHRRLRLWVGYSGLSRIESSHSQ